MSSTQQPDFQSLNEWVILSHIKGMNSRVYNHLLDTFQSPQNILASAGGELGKAGLQSDLARDISNAGKGQTSALIEQALKRFQSWQEHPRHHLLTRQSALYPALLSCIPDPPPLLYVDGNPESLNYPMIAMVGSRQPSAGGRRNARRFARALAANNIGIISGLALGVDVESHCGAIEGGANTVAALGTGIDRVYPGANQEMFHTVTEHGALVSEFNLGTAPRPMNFPQRNRIISGLSLGVLVVEASIRSGSMITARFALEQGRDVYAIPGSIHNPLARGCHKLIAEGAKLVQSVEDILEEKMLPETIYPVRENNNQSCLNETLMQIRKAIGFDPVSIDELVLDTGLDVQVITVALVELELMKLIQKENTGYVLLSP